MAAKMDKVCVGRGESAGGVGASAAAGCACRPAPSAVSAGARWRVGRRQVLWSAGAKYTVSAAEGLCRTAALESGRRASLSDGEAARAGLPLKGGKKIPALT